MSPGRASLRAALVVAAVSVVTAACRRETVPVTADDASAKPVTGIATPEARASLPAARPGMVWIPAGTLRAGTPPDRVPRVADEEMPGVAVPMDGFYIDQLPYPNEPGAIPTTNVTRDEAEQLCAAKGKRLCTELEWERACKGETGTTYEYGDAYRPQVCGTGASAEEAARRPSGERALCKSSFGVADLHGGVWQWTSSRWARGNADGNLGVLRGGNALAGELVGRCANAIGRPVAKKSEAMGLRCCAGPRNEAEVKVTPRGTPGIVLQSKPDPLVALLPGVVEEGRIPARAYRWLPVANDQLGVVLACTRSSSSCAISVARLPSPDDAASGSAGGAAGGAASLDGGVAAASLDAGASLDGVASAAPDASAASARSAAPPPERAVLLRETVGFVVPDLARLGDSKHLRLRGIDVHGTFSRDITYVYGRVDIGPLKRP